MAEYSDHPLLKNLTKEQLKKIKPKKVLFKKNSKIFSAKEKTTGVYFLLTGKAYGVYQFNDTGVKMIVETVNQGDMIGIEGAFFNTVSLCDYIPFTDCETLFLDNETFLQLIRENTEFSKATIEIILKKYTKLFFHTMQRRDIDINRVLFDKKLVTKVSSKYLYSKKIIPVAQLASSITVATPEEQTNSLEYEIKRLFAVEKVVFLKITPKEFDKIFKNVVLKNEQFYVQNQENIWFRMVKQKSYSIEFEKSYDYIPQKDDSKQHIDGYEIVSLLNKIIGEALDLEASDIHFEPYLGGMRIRYRIDGELVLRPEEIDVSHLNAVLSRIKVLARLDISERRKPQDGRLSVSWQNRRIDIRVSTMPTRYGEKIVLRILDPASILIDLNNLIIEKKVFESIKWMISQPMGMILVAGPTGSGKTTTVYSMLLEKKEEPINIVTIEDPIEYTLKGITQIQRNLHANLDFPAAIRSFLRQDPDVIIVGEVRDPETARASLEAGLTGHLVISTIHANNTFATVYRLKEMGMEPFILANSIIGIISQRLVRKVCIHCSEDTKYHKSLIEPLNLKGIGTPQGDYYTFRKGAGCPACNFKGYKGRTAIFEVLKITEDFKKFIATPHTFSEMEKAARELGIYTSMNEYGALLLNSGITTPEEISRVLFVEGFTL